MTSRTRSAWPNGSARRKWPSGGWASSCDAARPSRPSSSENVRLFNGQPGVPSQLRPARRAARRAGVPPRPLARGVGGDQLPPLLRHQRAGRRPDGGPGRLRGGASPRVPAAARAGASRACGSITSTGSTIRATTCGACRRARASSGAGGGDRPIFIVVEKILAPDEPLPEGWPVDGTTGYEFANAVNGLFVQQGNARAFDEHLRALHAATAPPLPTSPTRRRS